ncbi:Hypothetical predicted protein [Mytilus galloprovincialis]|uniref:Novel STAND NTPase 3 domain-containing protein n=1 Tax=Mytilus galloprovincialis TaxID=29158 RepID=A0A8B6EFY4_MYTGA|nr:Hypothetical predicted protein [Mytilus galloprovincialis]
MHLLLLMYLGLASFPLTYCLEFFCPSTSQWFYRAKTACNFADQYYCLHDDNNRNYTEICQETPTFDSPGHKVVIVGGIQGVDCEHDIYQPFKYWTNGSSTCAFKKTICNAEGQIIYDNGTTKTDRQCRCDYRRGYKFIKRPKYACYCEPSKEDCSCYKKECPSDFVLTPDYNCVKLSNWSMTSTCSMIPDSVDRDKDRLLAQISQMDEEGTKTSSSMPSIILSILIGLANITIFITALLIILIGMGVIFQFTGAEVIWQSHNHVTQDIIELQKKRKDEWKREFCNEFVKTSAYSEILVSIRNEQCVIVSGPAGSGKSSSTFCAALNLEETEKFDLWIISDPGDILKYSLPDNKQIFFIDDAFGKYTVSQTKISWWSEHRCFIKDILKENKDLKLVMTCRSYIYHSENTIETIKPFCHVNLLSEQLKLTISERRTIVESYKEEKLKSLSDDVVMLYNFFPSLCSRFHEVPNNDTVEYFTFPVNYIAEEVEHFRISFDPFYLALAVLVIYGNIVHTELFKSKATDFDGILKHLSNTLGYKEKPSKKILLSRFHALKDFYVIDKTTWFESLHENLFLMISHCISPYILPCVLLYGDSSLIKERVRLESHRGKISKFDILVPEDFTTVFFQRLVIDLEKGKPEIVFSSSQHTLPEFRRLFITYLGNSSKKRLEEDKHQIAVHCFTKMGYNDYLRVLED